MAFGLYAWSLCVSPAFAHHSFGAEYDEGKPVTLTGVVTKIEWTKIILYEYMNVFHVIPLNAKHSDNLVRRDRHLQFLRCFSKAKF
ncbi:MAG: DUF6152 family protein [Bryobacteraceae bacterium]